MKRIKDKFKNLPRRRRKVRHPGHGPDATGRHHKRGGGDPFESGAAGMAFIRLWGRKKPR